MKNRKDVQKTVRKPSETSLLTFMNFWEGCQFELHIENSLITQHHSPHPLDSEAQKISRNNQLQQPPHSLASNRFDNVNTTPALLPKTHVGGKVPRAGKQEKHIFFRRY
jgi:hypothetical protein